MFAGFVGGALLPRWPIELYWAYCYFTYERFRSPLQIVQPCPVDSSQGAAGWEVCFKPLTMYESKSNEPQTPHQAIPYIKEVIAASVYLCPGPHITNAFHQAHGPSHKLPWLGPGGGLKCVSGVWLGQRDWGCYYLFDVQDCLVRGSGFIGLHESKSNHNKLEKKNIALTLKFLKGLVIATLPFCFLRNEL